MTDKERYVYSFHCIALMHLIGIPCAMETIINVCSFNAFIIDHMAEPLHILINMR